MDEEKNGIQILQNPPSSTSLFLCAPPVVWRISDSYIAYETALDEMQLRADAIARGEAAELVWLLEHPPLFTAGTSARTQDLLSPERFPVFKAGRGGQYTYHGPGQRGVYVMLDLNRRGKDVRALVSGLERWMIDTLRDLGVEAGRREGRVGVWVERPEKGDGAEDKIGAIGIRLRRWVSFHGLSLNVSPDLEHYSGIVPCGISGYGITSLEDLGKTTDMSEVDARLQENFERLFGPLVME